MMSLYAQKRIEMSFLMDIKIISMIRIGYRAHDFGSFDSADKLASAIEEKDKNAFIQLALNKVIPSARNWKDWDEEYIACIREDLLKHGVKIGIVGCYIQPVHPDEDKRRSDIERFKKSIRLNKAFGCNIIATETGTRNPKGGYSLDTAEPKYIELFYSALSEMVEEAEKYNALCTIEAVAHTHTMSTPERMARMLEKFPSKNLKVLFDPVNLIPYSGIIEKDGTYLAHPSEEAQRAFYSPILDLYQDRLVAIHCKDFVLSENDGHKIGDIPALTGVFDWNGFIKELVKRGIDVPITLENLDPKTVVETKKKLESFAL